MMKTIERQIYTSCELSFLILARSCNKQHKAEGGGFT